MKYFSEILIILSYSFLFIYPQNIRKDLVNFEKVRFENFNRLSKIEYPGDSNIDVTYYKLNLTLNYDAGYIDGITTVSFKSKTSNLSAFYLDLQNSMKVDSIKMNGSKINFTRQVEEAKLVIDLPLAINPDQEESVDIYYGGTPISSGFDSFTFGNDNADGKAIFTLSEPYGASDWWPCKDTPADKADSSDVWMTVENDLTAVSNGKLQGVIDNGNGTRTFKWKNSYPIAPYLISMAVANYKEYDIYYKYSSTDSLLISNYIWQNSFNQDTKDMLDRVPEMIRIFSERYGPYPFIKEKYGNAQFGWGGGMEHQTITSLGSFTEQLLVHELAHQWFGDKVTCKTWNDIWLNEGFANYSEGIYYEGEYGEEAYNGFIEEEMTSARSDSTNSVYVDDIRDVSRIFRLTTSYIKGGLVLHMLRGIVGDSTFFKILRTYNSDPGYAYNSVTTSDFQGIAENISGLNLGYFFSEWIYGVDYPRYSLGWNCLDNGSGIYKLTIKLDQKPGTNPQYFTMPVQFKIITDAGDSTITVFNNKLEQEFDISVAGKPLQVILDPNNFILKDLNITGFQDRVILHQYKLGQNYPNPFNPRTKIRFSIPVSSLVTIKVYDVLGNEIVTLLNERKSPGNYFVNFDANNLPSGVYFYRMQAGSFRSTKKFVLLK